MKRLIIITAILALCTNANADNIRFAGYPSLSPDGKTIYFSYDGDIYRVPVSGGQATAVITMAGEQNHPEVSPDGKHLAFSSNIQGNNDVYVVTVNGGQAVQLTFHEAGDTPVGWSADSRYIYFESTRSSARKTTFRVSVDGGTPELMFSGFFNTIVNLAENPKTGEFLFNESMESISFPTRKRYIGAHNPNIKSWNPSAGIYTELTDYIGKDTWPMVDRSGNIYYVSDELNQESNIVKYVDGGKPQQLTSFNKSIQYPSIAFNGSAIVFLKDYEINVLDLASGNVAVPQISVASGSVEVRRSFNNQKPSAAAISPDGKKFALVIRGGLYITDTECEYLHKLDTPSNERVDDVVWDADSRTVFYTRTNKGWTNVFKIAADGSSAEQSVYLSNNNVTSLSVSHKNDKLAFIDGSHNILLYDVAKGLTKKIADAEFWSYQTYSINFSYDDNFIAFGAMNMFEPDIYIYDVVADKVTNLTNSASVEDSFIFAPDGKNAFLLANPTSSSYPKGTRASLYKFPLQKYGKPFKSETFEKLFAVTDGDKEAGTSSKTTSKKNAKKSKTEIKKDSTIKIDYSDFHRRIEKVENDGNQGNLYTFSSKGKDFLLYSSFGGVSGRGVFSLDISDPEAKPKQIKELQGGTFCSCKDALYCLSGGAIYKVDPDSGSAKKTEVSRNVEKVLADEFSQMFYEAWAALDQNYYDVNFHGTDWLAVRDYYASFLPYIRNRAILRTLMADMLGELNSSHLGFTTEGIEEKKETGIRTYATGIEFSNSDPYVVDRILKYSPADNIETGVRQGDILVAINGERVNRAVNREKYFSGAIDLDEIKLTFRRDGKEFSVKVHPVSASAIKLLAYKEWEDQRRDMVTEKTDGKVAYIHMQAMGDTDLNNFLLSMHTDAVNKDGLILDLRYNNGGNVHKEVIDFLRGEAHFQWAYRDFPTTTHPNVAPAGKPIVVLVNEHSLSDAEVTSNGIKTLGIAKLVGTETYRWIIFTSAVRLLDGSSCRMPAWGCYSLTGEDLEHTGVKPDIYVRNTFKDRLEGNDPQLEAAIKEVLRSL